MKWFDNRKGWGFVRLEDGREVFAHHRDVEGPGFRALHPEDEVECEVLEDAQGVRAVRIRPGGPA